MKYKVLIADDHKVMRTMIIKMLDATLFEFLEASNGEEALMQLKNYPDINLIICDLSMPTMTGLQFLNAKSQLPHHEKTAVIIITSSRNEEVIERCLTLNVAGILTKPFKKEGLDKILAKLPQLSATHGHCSDCAKTIVQRE